MKNKNNHDTETQTEPLPQKHDANSEICSVLEALEDLVSIIDHNYVYVAVSHGYTLFFGMPAQEIIGKTASEIHGADVFERVLKPNLDLTLAGEEVQLQFWRPDQHGKLRFIDSRHTPYTGHLVAGKGVAIVARDITLLKHTQAALEKERYLLNTIINAIPDFIFIKDIRGVYQRCNKSFEALLDSTSDEIVGKTDNGLMSAHSANYVRSRDLEVIESKEEVRCDEPVTYNDGQRRLVDMLKLPLFDENNEVTGIMGIGHDVTREREVDYKLQLAALVFETTSDCCFILSKRGIILSSNLAAKDCFPQVCSASEQPITDFFYCSNVPPTLEKIIRTEFSWHGEVASRDHQPFLATLNAVLDENQEPEKFVMILKDNSQHKEREKELLNQAYHDHLTGLPNRLLLKTKLESAIIRAERQRRKIAVLFIDLDSFKPVNDLHGHWEGDNILIQVAQRLQSCMRKVDTLSRMGGDEFIALIDITNDDQARIVAEKLAHNVAQPFLLENTRVSLTASIGISLFPSDSRVAEQLLIKADEAMYHSKNDPVKPFSFYTDIPLHD